LPWANQKIIFSQGFSKYEALNSKLETISNNQFPMFQTNKGLENLNFENSNLFRASTFGFRIS